MPYINSGQSRLYYEEYGGGPAIVFLHGVGGNHASWFNQIPTFAKTYRAIAIDQRGFGNSTDVEGLGRSAFVDDLKLLLDSLEIETTILVGQSMGGGTCLGFTCKYPDRVGALVLACTLIAMRVPPELKEFMERVEKATSNLSQAERVLGPLARKNEPERTLLYLQIASFNSVNIKTVKGAFTMHTPEELAATGVPILFVAGESDALFPPRAVRGAHARVPGSQYVELARSGHSAYFETPTEFNNQVLDFLSASRTRRDRRSVTPVEQQVSSSVTKPAA
jgi:3-oxoadipate enol-lactonase